MRNEIEVIVRAIIINSKKEVLLCRAKGNEHYFFPGGHVEFNEDCRQALIREAREELDTTIEVRDFIGFNEHFYERNDQNHHEFNIVFSAALSEENLSSQEDHIEFKWLAVDKLNDEKIFPVSLKASVSEWLNNNKIFFKCQS